MCDQLTLAGFEPPEYLETAFLDSVLPTLQSVIAEHGGETTHLEYKSTSAASGSASGYTALFLHKFTVFRLHLRGKQHYIMLPRVFSDLIPADCPTKQMKSEEKYIRILIDSEHSVESYTNFLVQIIGEAMNRYPKEWDCCSRYMECSDAKACVHPDKEFALGCGYRKVLNSGRIFYGENRNVDHT